MLKLTSKASKVLYAIIASIPIGLHIFMNLAWFIFTMEGTENAAGGLISNIARVISILLAVGLTIWYKKRNETKVFSYPVWEF